MQFAVPTIRETGLIGRLRGVSALLWEAGNYRSKSTLEIAWQLAATMEF